MARNKFPKGNQYAKTNKQKVEGSFDYKAFLKSHRQENFEKLRELSQSNSRSIALEALKTLIAYDIGKPIQPLSNDNDKPFLIKVETTNSAPYELHKQDNTQR